MLSARFSQIFLSSALFVLPIFAQNVSIPKPPETPLHSVTDDYYGIQVTDDYQWLENWEDPAVKQWSAAENARTREYLDHLLARPAIVKRLRQLANTRTLTYSNLQFRAGMLFAKKHQPNLQQPVLVVMHSPDEPASARVVFDPNTASSKGSVAIDFFVPSFGGKYVAAAISKNGSEDAEARVFEVTTGKPLRDVVPRVNFATAGGSIAWKFDNSGFYYTRYPQGNERAPEDANFYQQIYFHKLGTPSGKMFTSSAETFHASPRSSCMPVTTADGCWPQWATGTAASSRTTSWMRRSTGHNSRISKMASSPLSSAWRMPRSTCSRARMRLAARFCACLFRTSISMRPR